jgi:hypothetical protein
MLRTSLRGALLASVIVALVAASPARAQVGDDCAEPVGEVCSNLVDDDGDGLSDCLDPDCTPEGTDFVCGPEGRLVPACQPLLDDPAAMEFRTRQNLDKVKVAGRSVPLTEMDPVVDTVIFSTSNINGPVYSQQIHPGSFIPNTKFTKWKYVLKRTGSPMIYVFKIRKRYNKVTGDTEFILKVKAEGNLDIANPLVMTGQTLEELQTMTIQISVGDDVFYNTNVWERKSNGWYLSDKYMFM